MAVDLMVGFPSFLQNISEVQGFRSSTSGQSRCGTENQADSTKNTVVSESTERMQEEDRRTTIILNKNI